MPEVTLVDAINLALARALVDDPDVVVFGEDVGVNGGVFRATAGLQQRFGAERVFDTPLSEALIGGLCVGMAAQGLKPVGEIQFMGFLYPCIDQLVNHASRLERAARSLTEAGPAEPLKGMRRAMAQRMALAHAQVVPTTVIDEADINAWSKEPDITIRLVQAMAAACKAEPSLNAWYNAEAGERRLLSRVDVGIAVDLEGGLLVPVLRNVGERDSADLRTGLNRMRADPAARSIPPEELRGATITLSNFGMIGGRFASLVVIPPQVAIVGAGRAERRVVVNNDQQVVHRMLPLSLTFDHRAVTGGEAARFLAALKSSLEKP
jgi:pyruvate/2-oxoglutarate dehydrogenase complex dihydrolipoamide acyltransferase (E2) component